MPLGVPAAREATRLPCTTPQKSRLPGLLGLISGHPAQNLRSYERAAAHNSGDLGRKRPMGQVPARRGPELRSYEPAASPTRFCSSAMRAVIAKPKRVLTASMCVFDSALKV